MDEIYTPFEFFNLPDYLQRQIILEELDSESIENLCEAALLSESKKAKEFFSNFCKNSEIWRFKIQYEFPSYFREIDRRPFNSWKDEYENLKEKVKKYEKDFRIAIVNNDLTSVKSLLRLGVDPNTIYLGSNYTVMMMASTKGNLEIVEKLLAAGADVNVKDRRREGTALIYASAEGHPEVVEKLLVAGADVNAKDKDGNTALMWASNKEHPEIVGKLLAAGADVNVKDNKNGNTALIWASRVGHLEIVGKLLAAGANVNAKDEDEKTPLIWASAIGYPEIVEKLLASGANVNAKDVYGNTALLIASDKENEEIEKNEKIIEKLLVAGADINAQNINGETALYRALIGYERGAENLRNILTIIKYKPDPDIENYRGETALELAEELGLDIAVDALMYLKNEKRGV